jgi:FkbM family methyltransferase
MLLINTRNHPNVRPIQAGLWSKKTHLRIQDPNVATWSFRVVENSSGEGIPAVGIRDVMSEFGAAVIDVLKIDIEGSELEVLRHSSDWIDDVRTLIIELHDRIQPGCSEALDKALDGRNYGRTMSGESIVITNMSRSAT